MVIVVACPLQRSFDNGLVKLSGQIVGALGGVLNGHGHSYASVACWFVGRDYEVADFQCGSACQINRTVWVDDGQELYEAHHVVDGDVGGAALTRSLDVTVGEQKAGFALSECASANVEHYVFKLVYVLVKGASSFMRASGS